MFAASSRRPGYRSRRPVPALIFLAVLVVLSGFFWTRVFETSQDMEAATRCNMPSLPTAPAQPVGAPTPPAVPLGAMLPRTGLDNASPLPPQDVQVQVFNANGERRQATLVSEQLTTLGFSIKGEGANDPIYANYDLNCHGQIRFGGAGAGAARTLSLIAPCAQLVRDERQDATVDLALGSRFDEIKTSSEAKQLLQQLKNWVPKRDQGGAQQEVVTPPVSADAISEARDVHC